MKIYYDSKLKPLSRRLRKRGTLGEVLLWQQFKGKKINGYLFTRQKPIGKYIVDFYCHKLCLVIEIDGYSHNERVKDDQIRQENIERMGIKFLRFSERDIRNHLGDVILAIEQWIEEKNEQPI